jgi:hypothetical protein
MTQQVFADFIGTTSATLSGIFNERTRPTINIVEAIKKKIPDINTDWLMFGEGPMYRTAASPQADVADKVVQQPQPRPALVDPMIDFGPSLSAEPQVEQPAVHHHASARTTPTTIVREEVKYIDKPQRRVTEIRVYYDDQTWESFVPSKK